jgi:hypothetical protein
VFKRTPTTRGKKMQNVDQMVKEAKERTLKEYQENVRLKEGTAFANHMGWSDINPYEIVKRVSKKTLVVREMTAIEDESWKPKFVVGGFGGHCTNNNNQKWNIKPNLDNPLIRIRLSKNKGWRDKWGNRFQIDNKPRKKYDYNF